MSRARVVLLVAAVFAGADAVNGVMDEPGAPMEWAGEPTRPDAEALLRTLRSTFPVVPVSITGELRVMGANGEIERKLRVLAFLDWKAAEPKARYTICDAFGKPMEELSVWWKRDGTRATQYRAGDPLKDMSLPDLSAPVQGTDISWLDLMLAYLRWPGGRTVGAESVRSRFCFIVDIPAPKEDATQYGGVRLWIDPQVGILLQAAAYDHEGNLVKLLDVKSFKKIRDVWIIKDIDVQSFPARHRTRLRVLNAEAVEVERPGTGETGVDVLFD